MKNQQVIYQLNRLLSDYAVMYIKLHRYSWYVKGKHIFILQSFFQTLKEEVKTEFDHLATHILSIGGKPFSTMIKFVNEAHISEADADDEEEEMIAQLIHDVQIIQDAIHKLLEKNDHPSSFILQISQERWAKYLYQWKAYQENT